METGDHEERGAEQRRAPRIAADVQATLDQVRPLVALQADEDRAAERGEEEEDLRPPALAHADRLERLHHRHARADQQERHEGRQVDAQDVVGVRPVVARRAHDAVRGEQRAEADGVTREKDPHPELAPALRGERGLGGLDGRARVHFSDLAHVSSDRRGK